MKERPSWDLALRALTAGIPVRLGGIDYKMVAPGDPIIAVSGVYESESHVLCVLAHGDHGKQYTFPADLTLNSFIELCGGLTEDGRFDLAASLTLQAINTSR